MKSYNWRVFIDIECINMKKLVREMHVFIYN